MILFLCTTHIALLQANVNNFVERCVRYVDLDSQVSDSKRCPAEARHSLDRREQVSAHHSFCCDSCVLNLHSSVNTDPRDPRETHLHHEDTAPESSSTGRARMRFINTSVVIET